MMRSADGIIDWAFGSTTGLAGWVPSEMSVVDQLALLDDGTNL